MSLDPDRPGLFGSLSGEGGEGWRLFVTAALCLLGVLVLTAVLVAVR
jgi:hypothetical protein